jgi:hypothetical protein
MEVGYTWEFSDSDHIIPEQLSVESFVSVSTDDASLSMADNDSITSSHSPSHSRYDSHSVADSSQKSEDEITGQPAGAEASDDGEPVSLIIVSAVLIVVMIVIFVILFVFEHGAQAILPAAQGAPKVSSTKVIEQKKVRSDPGVSSEQFANESAQNEITQDENGDYEAQDENGDYEAQNETGEYGPYDDVYDEGEGNWVENDQESYYQENWPDPGGVPL